MTATEEELELPDVLNAGPAAEEPPAKKKPGRPPGSTKKPADAPPPNKPPVVTAAPGDDEKPKPKAEVPDFRKFFKFAHVGMMVWWYDVGTRENPPYPALITRKNRNPDAPLLDSVDITIFSVGATNKGQTVHRCESGVRHIDDTEYTGPDKVEIGAWDLTPSMRLLFDLVQDGRRK